MNAPSSRFRFDARRAVAISIVQVVLVVAAVAVSQLDLPVRANMVLVMGLTTLNAMLIAFLLLGVRRDGRLVFVFALITTVMVLGLLAWPAWDVYERLRY